MTPALGWDAPAASGPVRGRVAMPGSKSITNRALVLAALADAPSTITGALRARDTDLMAAGLVALGASVEEAADPDDTGNGVWRVAPGPIAARAADVDCGLAGTVARFLPPVAALGSADVRFRGDPRMSERPLGELLTALRTLGATANADAIPVTVRGPVAGGAVTLDASASSQLVSGLLLAAARMPAGLELQHVGPRLPSAGHLAMTTAMLAEHGVAVDVGADRWRIAPQPVAARDRLVEPDLSSASAFLAAAAATAGDVRIPHWPTVTDQPGAALPDLLTQMGCQVTRTEGELTVSGPDHLDGIDVDLHDAPELALTVAALATLARTPSRLRGIAHLRLQESDRLAAIATELGRLGAAITVTEDGLAIAPAPLRATDAVLDPHADHRLAMAYAVVGLVVPGVRIADVATTAKTVPGFARRWEDLVGRR